MQETLSTAIEVAHEELARHLDGAAQALAAGANRRDVIQAIDGFLARASRHVSAVCEVVVPAAKEHLSEGEARAHTYIEQCRGLERSLAQTKGRLYGSAQAASVPWDDVWSKLRDEFVRTRKLEKSLVTELAVHLPRTVGTDLAAVFHTVEVSSPTRPHPNLPHTGTFAHLFRLVWARADRFWDAAEGRIITGRPPTPPESETRVAS
jgi:hypothetical protein